VRVLAALVVLSAAPAHADVFGDATGGLGITGQHPTSALGLRGGVLTEQIGVMLGADWRYVLGPDAEDLEEQEHRVRGLASVVLPFGGPTHSVMVRLGGGLEYAHVTQTTYSRISQQHMTTSESFHGYVVEAGGAYFWRAAPTLSVGIELATGHSTYSGNSVDLLVAARFAR
jgi:hypothetical protein